MGQKLKFGWKAMMDYEPVAKNRGKGSVQKFSEDEARDEAGRWTSGGSVADEMARGLATDPHVVTSLVVPGLPKDTTLSVRRQYQMGRDVAYEVAAFKGNGEKMFTPGATVVRNGAANPGGGEKVSVSWSSSSSRTAGLEDAQAQYAALGHALDIAGKLDVLGPNPELQAQYDAMRGVKR